MLLCTGLRGIAAAAALAPVAEAPLLRDATFEELASITLTTVNRKPEPYFTTAAAAYVLTAEEMHRAGDTGIPEALRAVPGLQVARIDAYSWAISSRGFNTLFVDKLLVLVDGRSVYTPLWSGVYWEQLDWLDPDLDRIEVIRGPGGSVWGANAVNGVINVLSRPAWDTQGLALRAGGGSEERAFGGMRYGGNAGEDGWFRVYLDYRDHDASALPSGAAAGDAWSMAHGGFRYDRRTDRDTLTLKGELHAGEFDQPGLVPAENPPFLTTRAAGDSEGGYLQGRWLRELQGDGSLSIDAWYDSYQRDLRSIVE
jgi:iron complex outermembrane recepter protein